MHDRHITKTHSTARIVRRWFLFSALAMAASTNARAEPSAEALSLPCNGCHGMDGTSVGESIPSIAGQDANYLRLTMERYRTGERKATIMGRIARGYKLYQLRKIANHFAAKPWTAVDPRPGGEMALRGEVIHREHCEECHEDQGRYQDKDIPRLAGQGAVYLYQQLSDYARNDEAMPQPTKMIERLEGMADQDLQALSAFYSRVR